MTMPTNKNEAQFMRSPPSHPHSQQGIAHIQSEIKAANAPASPANSGTADGAQAHIHSAPKPTSVRDEIDRIKNENLTAQQLRIARRMAQKYGFQVTSDLDAVRVLRKNGIDPFQSAKAEALQEVGPKPAPPANLPAKARKTDVAKTGEPRIEDQITLEVENIRKNLVKRRRKRIAALFLKLICFIAIPSLITGYYFFHIATPMYSSFTEFVIQKTNSSSLTDRGGGGLLSGTPLASSQDSISVQGYLSSREAMLRLDKDIGFKQAFTGDDIDIIQRMSANVSNESAYKIYKKRIRIGFDPTEGIIKMEVITPSPELSYEFSQALISYAEQKVDQLTKRLRDDQMQGAREGYEKAETKYAEAQIRVIELQEQLGILSPESEISTKMGLIQKLEVEVRQKRLELIQFLDNPTPNQARVSALENAIRNREEMIAELRSELTEDSNATESLAKITAELQSAQAQQVIRQEMLTAALVQLETSRRDANRQTRYLSMSVSPTVSDKPSYPKAFENTFLSVVVFTGIFLIVSLTASILREQVTT